MVIAIEGVDASGKQTQARLLEERFRATGSFKEVFRHDFPHYQGVAGGLVGRVLRDEFSFGYNHLNIPVQKFYDGIGIERRRARDKAIIIQSLMLADRLEFFTMLRRFSVSIDRLLILDRYFLSGIVYGQADGLSRDWLVEVHRCLPRPDMTMLLNISVAESVRRRPERRDYYEKNLEKLERVVELYQEEMLMDSTIVPVDGTQTPEVIADAFVANFMDYMARGEQ